MASDGSCAQVSATEPDWSREAVGPLEWHPSRRLLRAIRLYQRHSGARDPVGRAALLYAVAEHRFWSAVTGADIPLTARLGGGLLLPHPNGVVIHPGATLGPNCLLLQQVTIGHGSSAGLPVLGGHVDVGAGAKILGGVRIGDHAKIGANAVVLEDVPEGATAVGIPARVLRPKIDEHPKLDELEALGVELAALERLADS
jgi:serine O-acetyltransferase